jgi:hypothetical protein
MLLDKVRVTIDVNDIKVFDAEGKLQIEKINGKLFNYIIKEGKINKNLDQALWNLVGLKVIIGIKNIEKLDEVEES